MGNVYKDEKGHFTNKENEGGPCHHEGGSDDNNKQDNKREDLRKQIEYKLKNEGNTSDVRLMAERTGFKIENGQVVEDFKSQAMADRATGGTGELFDDDYEEEFNDDIEMPSDEEIMKQRYEEEKAKLDKEFPDRGDPELEAEIDRLLDNEMSDMVKNAKKNGQNAQQALDSVSYDLDIDPEDIRFGKLKEMVKKEYAEPGGAIPHKPVNMPKYRKEKDRIVIEEGPHKGESYDSEEDYYNSVRSEDKNDSGKEPQKDSYSIVNSARGKEIKNILDNMKHMSKEEKKDFLLSLLED